MTITQNDIGKTFTLKGVKKHTYTITYVDEVMGTCGVRPSWSHPEAGVVYVVGTKDLRPLTSK